jgi:hypothetical protein
LGGALLALLGFIVVGRALGRPDTSQAAPPDLAAGLRFEHAVAQLLLRDAGVSHRTDPIVIQASEINGFLARHVEARRLSFRPVEVRLEEGRVELVARTSPRGLLGGPSWRGSLASILPEPVLELDVWLVVRGRLQVSGREGRLVVEEAAVGRQRIPTAWLWGLTGTDVARLLVWRVPRIVERLAVEPGRLVVYTRSR